MLQYGNRQAGQLDVNMHVHRKAISIMFSLAYGLENIDNCFF